MGGSISKKTKPSNESAQIYMMLNCPFYYAGDRISGNIYLNIFYSYPVNEFFLKLKGKEQTYWQSTKYEPKSKTYTSTDHRGNTPILTSICQLVKFSSAILPGHYSFPFTLTLPDNLPGSFDVTGPPDSNIKKVQIKYIILASLTSLNKEIAMPIEYKLPLYIRPLLHQEIVKKTSMQSDTLIKQCCLDKGHVKVNVNLEKSVFCIGEHINILATIDNSISKCRITGLQCLLIQKLQIRANRMNNDTYETESIVAQQHSHIYVESYTYMEKPLSISLVLKSILTNNSALIVEPSINNASIITCNYILDIQPVFDGCMIKSQSVQFNIYLYSPEFKAPVVAEAPHNWNPIQYTPGEITVIGGQMAITGLTRINSSKDLYASSVDSIQNPSLPVELENTLKPKQIKIEDNSPNMNSNDIILE